MDIKECEKEIVELETMIQSNIETLKKYQEHAGTLARKISDSQKKLKKLNEDLERLNEEETRANEWPKVGDAYWSITVDGDVTWQHCYDTEFSAACLSIGNCFRTREEAEFAIERLKVQRDMQKFAFEPDWNDYIQKKFHIYYDYRDCSLKIDYLLFYTHGLGDLVFESKERAIKCVAAIGEERLKKYYFGIKE